MDEKLDKKLVEAFPLLYRDRYGDKKNTLMVWGFECASGWFDLLWDLSSKLEPLIQKYIEENKPLDCSCSHKQFWHVYDKKCMAVDSIPYTWGSFCKTYPGWMYEPKTLKQKLTVLYRKAKFYLTVKLFWFLQHQVNKFFSFLSTQFYINKDVPCFCKQYCANHPAAMQVKEKFGLLRFYLTFGTEEMYKLVDEAEKKSAKVCEECGKKGKTYNNHSWLSTLCAKHNKERNKKRSERWKQK